MSAPVSGKRLAGHVVLVTGASSGIGAGTALAFAAEGATVVPAARRAERLTSLGQKIAAAGGEAFPLELDVVDEAQVARGIARIRERYGRLDGLVNSAGIMLSAKVADADTQDWRTMLDTNLHGLMLVTHAALPLMRMHPGGHVFNVSSISARLMNAGSPAYAASKAGVGAFTESLRKELSPLGMRVTLVMPGIVETELFSHVKDAATRERFGSMLRAMTPLQPADIANAIVYSYVQPQHVSINELVIRPTAQAE
jgi:NADP-dependent 3-hydroxy acid dehydrogenase YdfG